ncbi:asparaginase [Paenibacillus marinisediminis]
MEGFKVLVHEYRADVLENVHYGAISVVNDRGEVIHHVGDPEHMTFLRSAAKPFQALPAIKRGVDAAFGLTGKEASLFAASHRGEAYHIDALESMKSKAAIREEQLICGAAYPLNEEAKAERYRNREDKRRLFHNCSGKHMGMIMCCKLAGWDEATYSEPDHPIQQEILEGLSILAGVPREKIELGVDGCGLPVQAMPLHAIGTAYLKLACPDLIEDASTREAASHIAKLMNENPTMIADSAFVCAELLKDPNIAAKGGAKGVYGIGLRKERIGISLKVSDGSETVWPVIIATILERIGYDNQETIDRLCKLVPNEIRNDGGRIVGMRKAVYEWE